RDQAGKVAGLLGDRVLLPELADLFVLSSFRLAADQRQDGRVTRHPATLASLSLREGPLPPRRRRARTRRGGASPLRRRRPRSRERTAAHGLCEPPRRPPAA